MDPRYWQQFFDWINPVGPEFVRGRMVLEAGCGKGRHTEVIHRAGASQVVAVDIGEAVDIAFASVGNLPGVHIIQADIANMPLKPVFDYAFSVGVLHHMSEPYDGFRSLVSKLNPRGAVSCWVYGRENNDWIVNIVNPIRTGITARMPAALLKVLSALITLPLFLYCKFLAGPWRRWQERAKFLPNVFYQDYLTYIGRFDYTEVFNIVFDHLVAPVAFYLSQEQLRDWCRRSGIANPILRWHNKNSWTMFATKDGADPQALLDQYADSRKSGVALAAAVGSKSE
jgi:SAM-dependent methyltransferase